MAKKVVKKAAKGTGSAQSMMTQGQAMMAKGKMMMDKARMMMK